MTVSEVPQSTTGRKTRTWRVRDRHGELLGYVEWVTGWRQYVFNAAPAMFSADCLTDIIGFVARANTDHAALRAKTREADRG